MKNRFLSFFDIEANTNVVQFLALVLGVECNAYKAGANRYASQVGIASNGSIL